MGFFDQFLAKVTPEDKAVLDKYPDLKASVDRLETERAQYAQYTGEWNNWAQQNWLPDEGMTKAEKALREELAAAGARVNAAAASGADTATINALKADFDAKLADVKKDSEQKIGGMHLFYSATAKLMLPHQREFGEDLDPDALFAFMQQNGVNDPNVAHDRMMAAKRAEIATQKAKELDEKHAADIAAAEQRGREQQAREAAMGPHGSLPTDHSGGIAGVTAMVNKPAQVSDETKNRIAEARVGDGSLANLGYQMHLRGELPVQ